MTQKIIYIDTETGGTDASRDALLTIAMIVDIDGVERDAKQWRMQPVAEAQVSDDALKVNGLNREQIKAFQNPFEAFGEISTWLGRFVNTYKREDKFTIAGYQTRFDLDFFRAWWVDGVSNPYFGSYFNYYPIDAYPVVCWLRAIGFIPQLPNMKLATVCEYFGIPLGGNAHDSMADIRATKTLVELLNTELFNRWAR